MQLIQSSIGMEFVNALMEPVCGRMRRKLKPLLREAKLYRPTITQNIEYLNDEDVLSESEAEKQEKMVQKEKKIATKSIDKEKLPQTAKLDSDYSYSENAPLKTSVSQKTILSEDEEEQNETKQQEEEKASQETTTTITPGNNDDDDKKDNDDTKDDEKKEENEDIGYEPSKPFIFLAQKSEATLCEQWNDVLKNVVLNLGRLEAEEPKLSIKTENELGNKIIDSINAKFSYKSILENISIPLLDAIGDLKSAANITVEDVESSAKCLKYLRESHKTALNVFRKSEDPMVIIWSAALLTITTFFTATNFLIITDEDEENDDYDNMSSKLKAKKLRKERSQILRVLPQFDHILNELDERNVLFSQLTKICKSSMFLTNSQWILLDSILEYSTQISTVQFCILEERINSIIASILQQFNSGAQKANVKFTFPISYAGYFFTKNKKIEKIKDYYIQRAKVFMAKETGYYIKGKYKEMKISKTHKAIFDSTFKWTSMSKAEKHLFMRVLANKSKLKSITIESKEFSDDGCLYLSAFLNGSLMLQPNDELLYYKLSKLLGSLHEQYLWDYIDYHDKLSKLIDTTLISEETIENLNNDLQKILRHFQYITDWKSIKSGVPVDSSVFSRHQKSLYCLQRLFLSDCNITSDGVIYLSEALMENDSLKELILDNNEIGDSGAKAIGKMLSRNVALTEIDLSNNRIDKKGFCAIVVGWQVNKKYSALKTLDLSHNKTKLRTLIKDKSISVDVAVSITELKESVKVASF